MVFFSKLTHILHQLFSALLLNQVQCTSKHYISVARYININIINAQKPMFLLDDSQMELFLPYFWRVLEHGDMNRETLQIYNVRHELIDLIIETAAFSWVVMVVDEGRQGWEQLTNKSLWLVGGCGGRWRARRVRTTHQQVIVTRWWLWWLTKGQEGEIYTPTSCHDSLVVDEGPGGWG